MSEKPTLAAWTEAAQAKDLDDDDCHHPTAEWLDENMTLDDIDGRHSVIGFLRGVATAAESVNDVVCLSPKQCRRLAELCE
jgi:hypothetical protein